MCVLGWDGVVEGTEGLSTVLIDRAGALARLRLGINLGSATEIKACYKVLPPCSTISPLSAVPSVQATSRS